MYSSVLFVRCFPVLVFCYLLSCDGLRVVGDTDAMAQNLTDEPRFWSETTPLHRPRALISSAPLGIKELPSNSDSLPLHRVGSGAAPLRRPCALAAEPSSRSIEKGSEPLK